jgi:hypothetical protein
MSAKQLKTFSDIYTAVLDELKIQSSDTTNLNRVKRDINIVYLTKVLPKKPWPWARLRADVISPAVYTTGTVTIAQNSQSLTFSSAPSESKAGFLISIDGYPEVYKIRSHTAGETSAILESEFTDADATGRSFKIWPDGLNLPVDMLKPHMVWNDHFDSPMEELGEDNFLELTLGNAKREGRPFYYCPMNPDDPEPYVSISGLPVSASRSSSGLIRSIVFNSTVENYLEVGDRIQITGSSNTAYNGDFTVASVNTTTITFTSSSVLTESSTLDSNIVVKVLDSYETDQCIDRLYIYPYIYTKQTTIHINGIRNLPPLENDNDEPAMPVVDRDILLYGALARGWRRIRNTEEAANNEALFADKFSNMAARIKAKTGFPKVTMNELYLSSKYQRRRRSFDNF